MTKRSPQAAEYLRRMADRERNKDARATIATGLRVDRLPRRVADELRAARLIVPGPPPHRIWVITDAGLDEASRLGVVM